MSKTPSIRLSPFAILLCCAVAIPAAAQQYPTRPVRIVSPFAAGGGNDVLCRLIGAKLGESLKQQFIVENRAGANGIVGTEVAARAAPDGYTIALIPSGHAVNATLYKKLPYDTLKDFTTITLAAWGPLVLAVHPSLPAKNLKELIALARARPGQLNFASSGIGGSNHMGGELLKVMAKINIVHVPY